MVRRVVSLADAMEGVGALGLEAERVGLCLRCRHVRVVHSHANHDYYRCQRYDDDGRYARYPRLPMRRCDGYDPVRAGPGTHPVDERLRTPLSAPSDAPLRRARPGPGGHSSG